MVMCTVSDDAFCEIDDMRDDRALSTWHPKICDTTPNLRHVENVTENVN